MPQRQNSWPTPMHESTHFLGKIFFCEIVGSVLPIVAPTSPKNASYMKLDFPNFAYSQLCLIRTRVIRTFANSNKFLRPLENLLTKTSIIRISTIRNFCNSSIFTMLKKIRIKQHRLYLNHRKIIILKHAFCFNLETCMGL